MLRSRALLLLGQRLQSGQPRPIPMHLQSHVQIIAGPASPTTLTSTSFILAHPSFRSTITFPASSITSSPRYFHSGVALSDRRRTKPIVVFDPKDPNTSPCAGGILTLCSSTSPTPTTLDYEPLRSIGPPVSEKVFQAMLHTCSYRWPETLPLNPTTKWCSYLSGEVGELVVGDDGSIFRAHRFRGKWAEETSPLIPYNIPRIMVHSEPKKGMLTRAEVVLTAHGYPRPTQEPDDLPYLPHFLDGNVKNASLANLQWRKERPKQLQLLVDQARSDNKFLEFRRSPSTPDYAIGSDGSVYDLPLGVFLTPTEFTVELVLYKPGTRIRVRRKKFTRQQLVELFFDAEQAAGVTPESWTQSQTAAAALTPAPETTKATRFIVDPSPFALLAPDLPVHKLIDYPPPLVTLATPHPLSPPDAGTAIFAAFANLSDDYKNFLVGTNGHIWNIKTQNYILVHPPHHPSISTPMRMDLRAPKSGAPEGPRVNIIVSHALLEAHGYPQPSSNHIVIHRDGDWTNLALSNLCWMPSDLPSRYIVRHLLNEAKAAGVNLEYRLHPGAPGYVFFNDGRIWSMSELRFNPGRPPNKYGQPVYFFLDSDKPSTNFKHAHMKSSRTVTYQRASDDPYPDLPALVYPDLMSTCSLTGTVVTTGGKRGMVYNRERAIYEVFANQSLGRHSRIHFKDGNRSNVHFSNLMPTPPKRLIKKRTDRLKSPTSSANEDDPSTATHGRDLDAFQQKYLNDFKEYMAEQERIKQQYHIMENNSTMTGATATHTNVTPAAPTQN